jgi:hypothetical protein
MLELIIAILYIVFGLTIFKIDIEYNISGILSAGCFDGAGFNVLFIFYAFLSPIVICKAIINQFRKLINYGRHN